MKGISDIVAEHRQMEELLDKIEGSFVNLGDKQKIRDLFEEFEWLWKKHEMMEEAVLGKIVLEERHLPFQKTVISEHKELKGHWRVVRSYLNSKSDNDLAAALDTDGKMLIDKIRKHMRSEDEYLKNRFGQISRRLGLAAE